MGLFVWNAETGVAEPQSTGEVRLTPEQRAEQERAERDRIMQREDNAAAKRARLIEAQRAAPPLPEPAPVAAPAVEVPVAEAPQAPFATGESGDDRPVTPLNEDWVCTHCTPHRTMGSLAGLQSHIRAKHAEA
jgi:hypothetical protein